MGDGVVVWEQGSLRASVRKVGIIGRRDDGGPQLVDWHFDGEGRDVPETAVINGELAEVAGWNMNELHVIAHGYPC